MAVQPPASVDQILSLGRRVLRQERDGLDQVLELLDQSFCDAVEALYRCPGRAAVTGIGKAGLIGLQGRLEGCVVTGSARRAVMTNISTITPGRGLLCVTLPQPLLC